MPACGQHSREGEPRGSSSTLNLLAAAALTPGLPWRSLTARLVGEGVLRHSAEYSRWHLLSLPALAAWGHFVFLRTVDLALSPSSAVYVSERPGQRANVLHTPQNAEAVGLDVRL